MLHESDIRKRLKEYPEPDEVKEIRENIKNSFRRLEFQEGPHKYYVHNDDGTTTELPSVSGICHQFEPEADWDAIKERYAVKNGYTVEEVTRMWEEKNITATSNGTLTHAYGENMMHYFMGNIDLMNPFFKQMQYEKGYFIPYSQKQVAVMRYYEDIYKTYYSDSIKTKMYPIMPESQVYTNLTNTIHLKQPYAGTFDILHGYISHNKPKLMIHDFKGLPLDTPILTTNGFKTMGTLNQSDIVYDKDGNECKITGISEIHNNPCMRITFDDNYSIVADEEHRWLVYFQQQHKRKEKVMTTIELYEYLKKYSGIKRYSMVIPKIEINKPLNTRRNKDIDIDPYVFGVWLGDGHSACAYVTNMYDEIFTEIERRGYFVGDNVNDGVHCGKAKTRCVFGFQTQLRKYNLLNNKHIPDTFINGFTYNERFEILQGLMDTDGYYNKIRRRFVMSTTRQNQVEFTVKLLVTLGIKPTVIKAKGQCTNCKNKQSFERWDVVFTTNTNPFLVRKIDIDIPSVKLKNNFRNIKKIEYCDSVPTRCIEVNSPSHTYLADKLLLVTHNTNKTLVDDYARQNKKFLLPPFNDMISEPLSMYTIQLSAYQLGLQQLGYEVVDRKLIWLKEDGTYQKISVPDVTDKLIQALN